MASVEWTRSRYESDSASYEARLIAAEKFEIRRLENDGFPAMRFLTCSTQERAQRFLDYFVRRDDEIRELLLEALEDESVTLLDIILEAARVC